MKICVLIKQVPDTYGDRTLDLANGWLDRESSDRVADEVDERALEVALRRKDGDKSIEVVLVTMGPVEATDALRKGLAMGADSALHVLDAALAGSDAVHTSAILAAAIRGRGFDVILAGNESTDGRGGVVPAMVAERLGIPLLGSLDDVEIQDQEVVGSRLTELGSLKAHASFPTVVSVTDRVAEPRFPNFKGIMTAKKKPLTVLTLADLGLDDLAHPARSVVISTLMRPQRSAGVKIVDDGNAGVAIADFLAAGRLI